MIYVIALILLVLPSASQLRGAGAGGLERPLQEDRSLTCDPRLAQLFTPPRPVWGRYEVCTVAAPPGATVEDGFTYAPVERLEALDAFGSGGTYDRARLAQLYGGRRVEVRRGWKRTGSRFESVTYISPYPDASLGALQDGTLIIRWIAER